jgi:serine/threonine-protein kinase RsbW/stage II sporulation protein AB (anti-sigma F factor)
VARTEVVRIARAAGATDDTLQDIRLAVSEACTNAILHAYSSAGIRGESFTVATSSGDHSFSVWVTDEGRGIPGPASSLGLGLGLSLMARTCESVHLGVLDDGHTQVTMNFETAEELQRPPQPSESAARLKAFSAEDELRSRRFRGYLPGEFN